MEHKIYYLNLSSKQNTSNLLPAHVFTIQVVTVLSTHYYMRIYYNSVPYVRVTLQNT